MGGACGCDAWLSGLPWVNIFLHKRGISDCIFIPLLQLLEMGVVVLERSVCRRRVQLQRCRQSSGPEHAQKDRTSDQRKRHDAPRQGIQSWPSHRVKQKTEKRNISKTILCLIESTRLYQARAAASRQRPTVTVTPSPSPTSTAVGGGGVIIHHWTWQKVPKTHLVFPLFLDLSPAPAASIFPSLGASGSLKRTAIRYQIVRFLPAPRRVSLRPSDSAAFVASDLNGTHVTKRGRACEECGVKISLFCEYRIV